jgi:L-asparaginase II
MTLESEVHVRRGRISESRHRIRAVACDARGAAVVATAGGAAPTTFRSAARPFQPVPPVERGHADRWGFEAEDLAVMAASHGSTAARVARVRGMLARLRLDAGRLACGYHEALDAAAAERLRARPEERSPLYNDRSGRHAGMLALAERRRLEGYERPGHPVQRLMRESVAACRGLDPGVLEVGERVAVVREVPARVSAGA